jgi:hypothetical protein
MAHSNYTGANGVVWFWEGDGNTGVPDLDSVPWTAVTSYSINIETEVIDTTDLGCTDRTNTDGLRTTSMDLQLTYNSTNGASRLLNKICRPRIAGARAGIAEQQVVEDPSITDADNRRLNVRLGVKDIIPAANTTAANQWPGTGDTYFIRGRCFIRNATIQCQVGQLVTANFSIVLNGAVVANTMGSVF